MAHDVFISHSSRDSATADAVCRALEAAGIRCWIAPRNVPAGHSWKQSIVQAIRDAPVTVLILSGQANSSSQVRREVDIAFEAGRSIIPFRIEAVEMSEDLYYCIGSRHWLDALGTGEEHIGELVEAVVRLVPTAPAERPASSDAATPATASPAAPSVNAPATATPTAASARPAVADTPARARWRRSIRQLAAGGAVLGLLVLGLAAHLGLRGPPHVVVDVSSEAVTMVPSADLDLVGLAQAGSSPGSREAAGIHLAPPLIYLRGVAVHLSASQDSVLELAGDWALPAQVLQSLHVTSACRLHLDRLLDGSIRLGILQRSGEGNAEDDCKLRGQVWTAAPAAADSLDIFEEERWVPVPPRQVVALEAQPTPGRPASLNFRSADVLELHGIGVRQISFETRERGPQVESAILDGTIRFPRAGDDLARLRMRDTLVLNRLDGQIVTLTLGESVRTVYEGTSSDPRISRRSVAPGVFAQLYHSPSFWVALGLLAAMGGLMAALRVS